MSNDDTATAAKEGDADAPIELDDSKDSADSNKKTDEEMEDTKKEKNNETKDDDNKDEEKKSDDVEMKESEEEAKKRKEEEEKKREELKKKYANWPLRNIKEPHDNDVMYGRGGGTNHHPGNKKYRKMVEDRKLEYVNSKRLDKPLVALEIIRHWRSQLPPGRFLKLDEKTGHWNDVGDKKAREKTSQALREKAPLIRKQQEEEEQEKEGGENSEKSKDKDEPKTTRFAAGTKEQSSNQVKKAVLARDHSLGREYIQAGEAVSLEGFSWQDPFQAKKRNSASHPAPPPPPPTAYPPAGRNSSHGSLGMAPPHHASIGGPPPPPDFYGRETSHDRQRQFSNGRYESWGSPYPYPPPPPPGMNGSMHQRSGSWTATIPPPMPGQGGPTHQRSGSWGSGREHSLSFNPLGGAAVDRPANRRTFDSSRSSGSGYWADAMPNTGLPPPPTPPGPYNAPGRFPSGGGSIGGPYRQPISPCNSLTPPGGNSPKPPYSVDLNIAQSWSGGKVRSWDDADSNRRPPPNNGNNGFPRPVPGATSSPPREPGLAPRPEIVKRDTSNQCESYETKSQVKRAALNRDNSLASNRLKHQYMPEYFNNQFNSEQEVKTLSANLEQSTLSSAWGSVEKPKPKPLTETGRVSTVDAIAMELMAKPEPFLAGDRVSTIDALDLDLEGDNAVFDNDEQTEKPKMDLPKPSGISGNDRLTTQDFMDLVNAPIIDGRKSPVVVTQDRDTSLSLNQEKIANDWLTG